MKLISVDNKKEFLILEFKIMDRIITTRVYNYKNKTNKEIVDTGYSQIKKILKDEVKLEDINFDLNEVQTYNTHIRVGEEAQVFEVTEGDEVNIQINSYIVNNFGKEKPITFTSGTASSGSLKVETNELVINLDKSEEVRLVLEYEELKTTKELKIYFKVDPIKEKRFKYIEEDTRPLDRPSAVEEEIIKINNRLDAIEQLIKIKE